MEAANAVLLPMALLVFSSWRLSWVSLIAFVPMMLLLAIGAYYWRTKLKALEDGTYVYQRALRWIAILQWPSLMLTISACLIVLYAWRQPDWFRGAWDMGAATFAVSLAVLEYINYYHRQLQHFDNASDFRRLLQGKGLRRSQLARDLKAYRKR